MDIKTLKELLHLWVEKAVEDLEKKLPKEEEVITLEDLVNVNNRLKESIQEQKKGLEKVKQKWEDVKTTSGVVWTISRRKIPDELLSEDQLVNRRVYERKKAKETPEQREHRLEYMRNYHQKKKEQTAKDREDRLAKMRAYAKKKYWEKKLEKSLDL